jgi:hypothetical protein
MSIVTRTRNTHELKTGDVVLCHGSFFRLATRNEAGPDRHGTTVWFTTQYLGAADGFKEEIPAHWRADWTIQGNERANWSVVTAGAPRACDPPCAYCGEEEPVAFDELEPYDEPVDHAYTNADREDAGQVRKP